MHSSDVRIIARGMSALAISLMVLGTIGAGVWIIEASCIEESYGSCDVRDWASTIPTGIAALLLHWLLTGSILMLSSFISWRVSAE